MVAAMRGLKMALAAAVLAAGCSTSRSACLIADKPVVHHQSVAWQLFDVTVWAQMRQWVDVPRWARKLRADEASDAATAEEPATSFWTPRAIAELSPEAVMAGPTGPDDRAKPPFVVTKIKDEGKTGGFFVTDAKGDRYLFKLDVLGSPELVTSAEVISSKLAHALGYSVPSYEIETIDVKELQLNSHDAELREELDELLTPRTQDGRVRVCASRFLPGEILGPWRFGDHAGCRTVRALRLVYAWLNNTDAKDRNTLLTWSDERAIGYVFDFGSSLGANAELGPKLACQGWVNDVDLREWALEWLTLGARESGCHPREPIVSPAVGRFSAHFDPLRWKPYAPNLAFDEMTPADGRWIAERLAQLTPAQIEAAVAAGQLSSSSDAAYLVRTLNERRLAILRTYGLEEP